MAKTIVKAERPEAPRKAGVQRPANEPPAPPHRKTESALQYLNTFYPGWDTYLKNKET